MTALRHVEITSMYGNTSTQCCKDSAKPYNCAVVGPINQIKTLSETKFKHVTILDRSETYFSSAVMTWEKTVEKVPFLYYYSCF